MCKTMYSVRQKVWIAYTQALFPAVVTRVYKADHYTAEYVAVEDDQGVDCGRYPVNMVFDHEPHREQVEDEYGICTVWV